MARRMFVHFDRRATPILVSAMIMLLLLGFARIYTVTTDLKATQQSACTLRHHGRADTNQHERAPLRAALKYLANLGRQGAAADTSPARRAAAMAFAQRFAAFATRVRPLPNPAC
jgi:hypothetical protein